MYDKENNGQMDLEHRNFIDESDWDECQEERERIFLMTAISASSMEPLDALKELASFYTFSLEGTYENTIAYIAGNAWLAEYKRRRHPDEDELSKKINFYSALPLLVDDERPELMLLDMHLEDMIEIAVDSYDFTSPETTKALCWGVYQIYKEHT